MQHRTQITATYYPHRRTPLGPTATLLVAALIFPVLSACGSSGPTPGETAALAAAPLPAGKARVTITRVSTLLYAGAPATITLNGQKVADISSGGSAVIDVPAGESVLAASAWSYPGEFKVRLNAVAGQRYALDVAPRSASFGPGTLLGPIGGALDASVNENAGAFELKAAPQGAAVVAKGGT